VDLNGKQLSGVTATDTVYAFDSYANNHSDNNLGKLTVNGNVATDWYAPNGNRYIAIENEVSLASEKFRQEAGEVLRQLIRHMKGQPYYNRVFGIKISGGQSYEWMVRGTGVDQGPDYSPVSQAGFRDYLQRKYGTVDALCSGGHSYTDKATYTREIYAKKRVSELYALFIDYYANKIDNFAAFVRNLDSVEMVCSFFENDEDMLECTKKIEAMGHFKIASSEPTNIEIYHKNAGKGNSLLRLADMLGVPYENAIAVGDSKNDMDMIQKAGLSLAMSNACDELKEAADRTICSCTEHSADFILKNYFS
jgi:hypothetical protein